MKNGISRRGFLKGIGLGAVGTAAAGLLPGCSDSVGAQPGSGGANWDGAYEAGSYTAVGEGKNGELTVETIFGETSIDAVSVVKSYETESIFVGAERVVPQAILDGQTLNVDAVSGATYSSNAILEAVADCVAQAGGDPETLKKADPASSTKSLAAGTYQGVAHGHHSDVRVECVFGDAAIECVTIVEEGETFNLADAAFDVIPDLIVDKQSIGVDVVSGATFTSRAIMTAVCDCLDQAGGAEAVRGYSTRVPSESDFAEQVTVDVDVVVIGSGMAGISAALAAQDGGAKVAIVEKLPYWGGVSQTSGGGIACPFDDSEEAKRAFYQGGLDMPNGVMDQDPRDEQYPDPALMNLLAEKARGAVEWLGTKGLQYSWREAVWNRPEFKYSAALMIIDELGKYGEPDVVGMNFEALINTFTSNGGEVYLGCRADSLIMDGSKVTGVSAEGKSGSYTFNAKSVVLAAGGFGSSPSMIKEYAPSYIGEDNVTLSGNVGEGIKMATAIGAAVYDDALMMGNYGHSMMTDADMKSPWNDAETSLASVFVNPQGLRVNSEKPASYTGGSSYVNPDSKDYYWVIINKAVASQSDYLALLDEQLSAGNERFFTAETLPELAKKIMVTPNTLRYTLNHYNRLCELGEDSDFNKPAEYLVQMPQSEGPWYAVKCYVTYFGTVGGLKVNTDSAVLDSNGNAIPGLYAAGENANHGFFNLCYMGGRSLTACLVGGRVAGENAAINA